MNRIDFPLTQHTFAQNLNLLDVIWNDLTKDKK